MIACGSSPLSLSARIIFLSTTRTLSLNQPALSTHTRPQLILPTYSLLCIPHSSSKIIKDPSIASLRMGSFESMFAAVSSRNLHPESILLKSQRIRAQYKLLFVNLL